MKTKTKIIMSLILNSIIVLCEIWAISNSAFGIVGYGQGYKMFTFFTEDSNIFLGISCILVVIFDILYLAKGKEIPFFISIFKFLGTVAVTTTFLTVAFYLLPITYSRAGFMMWGLPTMFFTHLVCPILAFVSYLFFDAMPTFKKRYAILADIAPLTYGLVILPLASCKIIDNIYGFMDATVNPWFSVLMMVLILGLTYVAALLMILLKNKMIKKETETNKQK